MSRSFKTNAFPSDFVSRKEKTKIEYGRQYAKAIYANYVYNNSDYEEKIQRYIDNRRYAEGLQRIDKYKDLMGLEDSVYLNLDWSAISIIPVFIDLMVGEIMNSDFKISASAVDPMSNTSKDKEKASLIAKMKLKELDDFTKREAGISIIAEEDYVPASMDEIDLHMQMNFKLATEVAIEEFVDYVFKANDNNELKRKIYRDYITLKIGACKVFINEYDQIELRYVDPVNFITSFSQKDDFSDARFAAEVIYIDIAELRRMANGELSEAQLFDIAKSQSKKTDRRWEYGDSYEGYYNQFGDTYFGYDDFLIPVMDFQFISTDIKTFEEKENKYGGIYINEKSWDYDSDDPKKKIHKKEIDYKYGGYWVVGTEHMFGYGVKKDIVRDKKNGLYSPECSLDYIVFSPNKYDMENKSLVERMIPHADKIQLASLKMQHLMMKLKPSGLAVDVGSLHDIMLGKMASADPLDLVDFYEQQGTFFYNGKDEDGLYSNRPPIAEIKNTVGPALQELIGVYEFERQKIRDITGINEIRDGISVKEDVSFKTQQLSLKASRNSTKELQEAFLSIYRGSAERIAGLVIHLIQNGRMDQYRNVIGKLSVDILEMKEDMRLSEFGIFLEALPDDEEKQLLEQNIQMSLQQGELRLEDAIQTRELSKTSITQANQYMVLKRKQYQQEKMEESQALQQQNAEVQQQSAQQAHELKMQEEQMELQKMQMEYQLKDQNSQKDHERKMKEIELEGKIKSVHIEQAGEEDFKNTALSDAVKQPRLYDKDPVN